MNKDEIKNEKEVVERKETKSKPVTGVVANCTRLNVRHTPKKEAGNIITDIPRGTKVIIDEDLGEFYKVSIVGGANGFCMSEFISKK